MKPYRLAIPNKSKETWCLGSLCVLFLSKGVVSVKPFEMLTWCPGSCGFLCRSRLEPSPLSVQLRAAVCGGTIDQPALSTFLIPALKGQMHLGTGQRGAMPENPRGHQHADDSAIPPHLGVEHNGGGNERHFIWKNSKYACAPAPTPVSAMELRLTGLNQLRISGMHYIYLNTHTRTYTCTEKGDGFTRN